MSTIAYKTFKITNTKLYVLIVTLLSKDNVKLAKDLKDVFMDWVTKKNRNKRFR